MIRLPYKVRARLQPALITAVPLALGILVWFPKGFEGQAAVASLLSWAGITGLVMTLARDRGKAIEAALWRSWGGPPTTRMLRYRDTTNKPLLALRHQALRTLVPEITLPKSAAAEAANTSAADAAYEACASILRSRTRDGRKCPLVFEENCDYGFRRNLLGVRPWGIVATALGLAAVGAHTWKVSSLLSLDLAAIAVIVGASLSNG